MIPEKFKLKNTVKYPTSLIIGGLNKLGLEIADSLIEQGGYVIIVDTYTPENLSKLEVFSNDSLISFVDYVAIPHLDEEIRRLDYVFFLSHESNDLNKKISTQEFLNFSNYLDATLNVAKKFQSKFLLTTSIKAHQLVITGEDFLLNIKKFGETRHASYTEIEVQRYAESLVLEFYEDFKIDTRIIRMGEVIGEGLDFAKISTFNELILAAAEGKPMTLTKDGLETEWYVHSLDAAYGIIKAQFSRMTNGQTFTLAYEAPLTHLSLAYKIQEVENDPPDIIFAKERDSLPPLKYYKAEQNLATIGWSPKVSLEKAIRQSLAAAKIYLLEGQSQPKEKSSVSDKIKDFFSLAETNTQDQITDNGPISRLIAERKRQEELKKKSMELANQDIKIQRKRKPRTLKESVNAFMWDMFIDIGNTVKIFKNKTPTESGLIVIAFFLLLVGYLYIFSPIFILWKDTALIQSDYKNLITNYSASKITNLDGFSKNIKNYLASTSEIIKKYDGIFSIVGLGKQTGEVKKLLADYQIASDGMENLVYAFNPLQNYISEYKSNLILRSSDNSFLSVSTTPLDYSSYLEEFNTRSAYIDLGIEKISKAADALNEIDMRNVPLFLQNDVQKINAQIQSIKVQNVYLKSLKSLPQLLGLSEPVTHAIFYLDNSRPTPLGGEIAAYAYITVEDGGIKEVQVAPIENLKLDTSVVVDKDLKEINLRRFTYKNINNLTFKDLGSIYDINKFGELASRALGKSINRKVTNVLTVNNLSIENLITSLAAQGNPFLVNSVNIAGSPLISTVVALESEQESIEEKHKLLAQILATTISQSLLDTALNIPYISKSTATDMDSENVRAYSSNEDYAQVLTDLNWNGQDIYNRNFYLNTSISLEDPKIVNPQKYSTISVASDAELRSNLDFAAKVNIGFSTNTVGQEVSVCMPIIILNSDISVQSIPQERVAINANNTEKCVVAKIVDEKEIIVNLKTNQLSSFTSDNLAKITFGLAKFRAGITTYDQEINLATGLSLKSVVPQVNLQNQSLVFTQTLQNSQQISLELTK